MSKEDSYKKEPHVYAEVIKAWADGQDIEFRINDQWCTSNINSGDVLSWSTKCEYRIKPTPPKPPKNIELYANAEFTQGYDKFGTAYAGDVIGNFSNDFIRTDNLKLTFCSITGKLLSAEVVEHNDAKNYE